MVSIQEARNIVDQRRKEITQQRQQLQQARQNIEQSRLEKLTRAELQVRTREDILSRKRQQQELQTLKKTQISQLKPFETELSTVEQDVNRFAKEVGKAEDQQREQRKLQEDINSAFGAFDRGSLKPGANKRTIRIFEQIQASARAQKEFRVEQKKMERKIIDVTDKLILKAKTIEKPSDFKKILDVTKSVLFGEAGKKFVGINIFPKLVPFQPKDVTAQQIKDLLRKGGLPTKVVAEFVPTTPAQAAVFATIPVLAGASIPIVSVGVRLGIGALGVLTALDTKQKPETRIAGTIVAVAPFIPILKIPKGKRGQARFAELEEFFKKQKKKKLDLDKVQIGLQFKQVGKTLRETTRQEKITEIRKMFDAIKKTKDPKLRKQQIEGTLKFLEGTFGKSEARLILKDFLEQEGFTFQPKAKISTNFKKFVQEERVDVGKKQLQKVTPIPTGLFLADTEQIEKQEKKLVQTQANLLIEGQKFFQPSAEAVKQAERLKQVARQKQRTRQLFFTALRTIQVEKVRGKIKPRPPKPKIKLIPILKLPKGIVATDLVKAIQKLGKDGVNIIVGIQVKKRKIIGKNLPKWKALKKAQRFVDTNIEASYLLKKSGKKARGKDIKPFNPSFKFRSSKTNPLFVVEKRKFRLDTPTEIRQLKTAKLNVPRGFFPKVKKKRKKKK